MVVNYNLAMQTASRKSSTDGGQAARDKAATRIQKMFRQVHSKMQTCQLPVHLDESVHALKSSEHCSETYQPPLPLNESVHALKSSEQCSETCTFLSIPADSWLVVVEYLGDLKQFLDLQRSCRSVRDRLAKAKAWQGFATQQYPRELEYLLGKRQQEPTGEIREYSMEDATLELKVEAARTQAAVLVWTEQLQHLERAWHDLRSAKDDKAALGLYKIHLGNLQAAEAELGNNPVYRRFVSRPLLVSLLRGLATAHSNAAQAWLDSEEWPEALVTAMLSTESLDLAKKLLSGQEMREHLNNLGLLTHFRLQQARAKLFPNLLLTEHSDQPVAGITVGTVLQATSLITSPMFSGSLLILYEHDSASGSKGLVLNKHFQGQAGTAVRLGGPCQLNSAVSTLHNIPDVSGAEQLLAGVYRCGDLTTEKLESGECRVRRYHGFAAWRAGQLDGELRAGKWTQCSTASASDVFDQI